MIDFKDRLAEMNRQGRAFWAERQEHFAWCLRHPTILHTATAHLQHEISTGVPLKKQTILEKLVENAALDLPWIASAIEQRCGTEAAKARAEVFRQRAQKGGRAKKADSLTCDIRERLRKNPSVTNDQLFEQWEAVEGEGLIHAFNRADGSVTYFGRSEKEQSITFANLRARISRERKNLRRLLQ